MKQCISLIISCILLLSFSICVFADSTDEILKLSDASDEEIAAFLDEYEIEVPGGDQNFDDWISFIREVIGCVEDDPSYVFAYGFTVAQSLADELKTAVLMHYGYDHNLSVSTYAATYTMQDSTPYGNWYSYYENYNCYAYSLGRSDGRYNPGVFSGIYYSTLPMLSYLRNYVESDLNSLGYSCVNVTTSRPTSSTVPAGAKAICLRIGDVDYHFMKLSASNWMHKPGGTQPLIWNYASPEAKIWTNERVYYGVAYEPTTYTSTVWYFVYKISHGSTITVYTGDNYHSGTSHYFLYQDVCEDCGYVYSTYYVSNDCDGPPCQTIHPNSITTVTYESE